MFDLILEKEKELSFLKENFFLNFLFLINNYLDEVDSGTFKIICDTHKNSFVFLMNVPKKNDLNEIISMGKFLEKNASIFSNVLKLMSDENHFDIVFRREPLKEKRVEMPEKIENNFLKYVLDNKIKKSSFNNGIKI